MGLEKRADVALNLPQPYRDNVVIDGLVVAPQSAAVVRNLIDAGITACNWTVASHSEDTLSAINKITQFYWLLEQHADYSVLIQTGEDIDRAKLP